MDRKEFNSIITEMNISNTKGGLVLEAQKYRDDAEIFNAIGDMLISIGNCLENTAEHLEKLTEIVNACNTIDGRAIITEAENIRENIESKTTFKSGDSHAYLAIIANIADIICDPINENGEKEWSSFIKKSYERMRDPEEIEVNDYVK
jgi:hypothetical protein